MTRVKRKEGRKEGRKTKEGRKEGRKEGMDKGRTEDEGGSLRGSGDEGRCPE